METYFKAIIVDDEQHAIDSLSVLLKNIPEIICIGMFDQPQLAFEFVIQEKPDIIFLDIQMPELSGIDFAKRMIELNLNIPVIFTTAHDEFLLEALHVNAMDYMLKPISVPLLREAIDRVKQRTKVDSTESLKKFLNSNQRRKLRFNTRNGFITFFEEEVIFIQADGVYSNFKLKNGKEITVSQNLGKIEEQLQLPELIKIHRSVIVNSNYIFEINKGKKECTLAMDGIAIKLSVSTEGIKLIDSLTIN